MHLTSAVEFFPYSNGVPLDRREGAAASRCGGLANHTTTTVNNTGAAAQ